ncbi:MAG TPA: nodulation protein NfeD [Myxococcota bacterium]|nr:nodulation protein NfeD [Myxococcota bacterium]
MRRARCAFAVLLILMAARPAWAAHIHLATISGTINPASADYLRQAIATSERDGAAALLVELDTPGGLLASTKDVIQAMLNAGVPVIVYVAPAGAWAGSAGTFITLAANVAAMAPGTSIGAAHPVGIGAPGGGQGEKGKERDFAAEKAENFTAAFIESIAKERKRNVEWAVKAVRQSVAIPQDEALKLGVIDLVAADREELLRRIDGRETLVKGKTWKLAVAGAEVQPLEMPLLTRILDVLATPDIAVLLILAGALGLYVEFTTPGVVVPGVVGAICLLLGFFSLQILPFSWLGLLLMLGGVTLIVAEVFLSSYGLLFVLGVACFLIGGARLFDRPDLSDVNVSFWSVLVPAVAAVGGFGAIVVFGVVRSLRHAPRAGVGELVGMIGKTASPLEPDGTVFVRGEYWSARADAVVPAGVRVEVTAVEGLRLRVRLAPPEPQ